MQLLTSESWGSDHPRVKHRVGNKVVYILRSPSDSAPMYHEFQMMECARAAGVRCPAVHSYSRVDNLEVSVVEYVEGRTLA